MSELKKVNTYNIDSTLKSRKFKKYQRKAKKNEKGRMRKRKKDALGPLPCTRANWTTGCLFCLPQLS